MATPRDTALAKHLWAMPVPWWLLRLLCTCGEAMNIACRVITFHVESYRVYREHRFKLYAYVVGGVAHPQLSHLYQGTGQPQMNLCLATTSIVTLQDYKRLFSIAFFLMGKKYQAPTPSTPSTDSNSRLGVWQGPGRQENAKINRLLLIF